LKKKFSSIAISTQKLTSLTFEKFFFLLAVVAFGNILKATKGLFSNGFSS